MSKEAQDRIVILRAALEEAATNLTQAAEGFRRRGDLDKATLYDGDAQRARSVLKQMAENDTARRDALIEHLQSIGHPRKSVGLTPNGGLLILTPEGTGATLPTEFDGVPVTVREVGKAAA